MEFSTYEINKKFESFVDGFLSAEKGVQKTKIGNRNYLVEVPTQNFSATITCKSFSQYDGQFVNWLAVAEDNDGEVRQYLLFDEEQKVWEKEQRKLRGIK